MEEQKEIVYVACFDNSDFLNYQREHAQYECIMLIDGNVLRGRNQGKIIHLDRFRQRWNWLDIQESIEREQMRWSQEQTFDYTHEDDDQTEIDYGV